MKNKSDSSGLCEPIFGVLAPLLARSSWRHDLCLVNQGHGHVCAADDVLHHAAGGLLHRLDLRWRHNSDAVLPENPVSLNLICSLNDLFVSLKWTMAFVLFASQVFYYICCNAVLCLAVLE